MSLTKSLNFKGSSEFMVSSSKDAMIIVLGNLVNRSFTALQGQT